MATSQSVHIPPPTLPRGHTSFPRSPLPSPYMGMIPPSTTSTLTPYPTPFDTLTTAPSLHPPTPPADPITPTLLSKHHLPRILLTHGPLAIRYLTSHLISSVPGFSAIPPGKQRRLVVAALEGRSGGTGGRGVGGVNGEVVFEKIGWGRWSARMEGEGQEEEEELGMEMEMEMEMGDETGTSGGSDSEATDEEDWEAIGCEVLRRGGSPQEGFLAASWRGEVAASYGTSPGWGGWGRGKETEEEERTRQEREAVEALVKLSSI